MSVQCIYIGVGLKNEVHCMKKNMLFLLTIAILSLTSCSRSGYFEGFSHVVDKDDFSTLLNDIDNVECRDENGMINDFALSVYSLNENSQTVLYKNGNRRKMQTSIEITMDGEYDASTGVYHSKKSNNTVMETDNGSAVLNEKEDVTLQNTDGKLYSYDNLVKTFEIESDNILCSDYVSDDFSEFQFESNTLAQIIMQYNESGDENVVYYKDKNLYTRTLKSTITETNKTEMIKTKVQFMFTKKRCFVYNETIIESVLENENQKISTKTYSYEKKEYNFRNFSIKPVNVTKYNSD